MSGLHDGGELLTRRHLQWRRKQPIQRLRDHAVVPARMAEG